jgi:hypothetical protein
MKKGFAFAGSNAYRATKITSVHEIFTELLEEYKKECELHPEKQAETCL